MGFIGNSLDVLHSQFVAGSEASFFVRKALQVRLRDQQCVCIAKLGGKDLRFSMKMMLTAGFRDPGAARLNCRITSTAPFTAGALRGILFVSRELPLKLNRYTVPARL